MRTGTKLKKLRELRNLTQTYLAESLGIKQSTYSRYEKGELEFTNDMLIVLSKTLTLSVEAIQSFDETLLINYIDGFYRSTIIIEELRKENANLHKTIQTLRKELKNTTASP